ncbi:MAG: hypothetical protein GX802_03445 [Clostridiales bacterium]|jgi:hypothetical protein|nr:hypothetical protein [Clostridiales bacterium]
MYNDYDWDKLMSEYDGKTEDELMLELMNTIHEQSRNGNFDTKQFLELCEMIDPMLTNSQREKLNQIIAALK